MGLFGWCIAGTFVGTLSSKIFTYGDCPCETIENSEEFQAILIAKGDAPDPTTCACANRRCKDGRLRADFDPSETPPPPKLSAVDSSERRHSRPHRPLCGRAISFWRMTRAVGAGLSVNTARPGRNYPRAAVSLGLASGCRAGVSRSEYPPQSSCQESRRSRRPRQARRAAEGPATAEAR